MISKLDIHTLIEFTKTLNILYVEDNKEARDALKGLMSNFFDNITIAVDGLDAVEKFKSNSYDFIITDIRMPKMNGIEMINTIRLLDDSIPIVVSTAHTETDLLIDCIRSGVTGYLLKPISHKQLKQTIEQVCEKIYYKKKNKLYEESLEELVKERTKELEETQKKLIEMTNRDPLSNLYNRRYFNEIAFTLMQITKREKKELSLLMIDIDKFKNVNDKYGHIVGDMVIVKLSNILLELTRHSDIVVRFGGEEFLIILPNTQSNGAIEIATKIRNVVEKLEIHIENHIDTIIKFTVSIGIAKCDCSYDINIDNIVHRADEALYEAKRNGRNKVVLYEKKNC